eukprot:2399416-Lingulodinium_polyedra.AAC.1
MAIGPIGHCRRRTATRPGQLAANNQPTTTGAKPVKPTAPATTKPKPTGHPAPTTNNSKPPETHAR